MRAAALVLAALVVVAPAAVAEPVRFRIDPAASEITFRATSRLQTADGRFGRFRGEVDADPRDPTTARVRVGIDAASIDTANGKRDTHLRSADFFWVERHPEVAFESTRVERTPTGRLAVVGRLTMRGVARDVTAPVDVELGEEALTARGELVLNRKDYGISYNSFFNPVHDTVRVAFRFRATRE